MGAIIGWAYWGAWLAASSFVSQGFGHYLHALTGAPPLFSAVMLLLVLGVLNLLGIRFSGKLQVGIVFVVLVVLIGFFVLGLKHVNDSYYRPFAPNGLSGILEAALVGFLSLVGWDAIVASGEEVRNPRKTVPFVIFCRSPLSSCFIWVRGSWPDSDQFHHRDGLPATCNAFIMTISRMAFAMARNGLLPKAIASIHPRFRTPTGAIVLGVGIQIAFTLVSTMNIAVTATGFLYLLTFIFSMFAFFIARRRGAAKENDNQLFFVPFYPIIPMMALLICIALLIPIGKTGFLTGLIWLLIGVGIYLLRMKLLLGNRVNADMN